MSDAARLARQSFLNKPPGASYLHFKPSPGDVGSISAVVNDAIVDSAYSAVVSYAEALSGLKQGSISWSIVRLYYSCFYSIRALLLLGDVVPFNSGGDEMLLDIVGAKFAKGGRSSHHWNWTAIRKIARLSATWYLSQDSQDAYDQLREYRENVNYTHVFTDPNFHQCLITAEPDLTKRFRSYRDDGAFVYTYLADHLAIAYPTKLIFALDAKMRGSAINFEADRVSHIKKIWTFKDRCPIL